MVAVKKVIMAKPCVNATQGGLDETVVQYLCGSALYRTSPNVVAECLPHF
jgi:hypothetical protein